MIPNWQVICYVWLHCLVWLANASPSGEIEKRPAKLTWNATFSDKSAYHFKCPSLKRRSSPPRNVHDVRPDDIQVIMAVGDSILAGLNSRFPHGITDEYKSPSSVEHRGVNFATGADPDAISIGKLLKRFQPNIAGLSHGTAPFEFCYGPLCVSGSRFEPFMPNISGLNAAQAGAWATRGNIKNQFLYLDDYFSKITAHVKPRFKDHEPWKLAVVQIGANNLCLGGCHKWTQDHIFSVQKFHENARYILNELRRRYKNMIVLLMSPLHLSEIEETIRGDSYCMAYRHKNSYGCPCMDLSKFHPEYLDRSDTVADEYGEVLRELTAEFNGYQMADFGVVYDDGLLHLDISGQGVKAVSGLDCLHPSIDSHSRVAIGAWYNLFHRGKRDYVFNGDPDIFCPDEHSRIIIN